MPLLKTGRHKRHAICSRYNEPTFTELFYEGPSRRFWVRRGLVLILAFVAILFVPYGRDHVNPPTARVDRVPTHPDQQL